MIYQGDLLWELPNQSINFFNRRNFQVTNSDITKILDIQQVYLTISASNLNINQIDANYLKATQIIPQEWLVIKETDGVIIFDNKVKIMLHDLQITFTERISYNFPQLKIVAIANQYLQTFPNDNYQNLIISFRRLISLPGKADRGLRYFQDNIVNPQIGKDLVSAKLNLLYQRETCPLILTIQSAQIRQRNQSMLSALFFRGKCKYSFKQISEISYRINDWLSDWQLFIKIINQGFLKS